MYRSIITLCILALFSNTFAAASTFKMGPYAQSSTPYNVPYNYNNNYYHNPNYYNSTYNPQRINSRYSPQSHFGDINALEKYSMNRTFGRESDLQRLQRLEMQAFGAVQSGDINQRYDNVRNAILSRPNYTSTKTSLLRNIGNYFSGQMTGFTPYLGPDPFFSSSNFATTPYPTTYGNQSVDQYSTPFGGGYRINNYGTGSSTGVRILD